MSRTRGLPRRLGRALPAALLPLLLVLGACGSSESSTGAAVTGVTNLNDDGYQGVLLDKPYTVPDVTLTDTAGKPFDLATQAKRTLVFFGYTNCPDICSTVMSTIASAMAKLSDAERAELQVVFVTTDPQRDTREVIRSYVDRFDPSFKGATGSIDDIDALGTPMDIYVKKGQKLPSGGYEVDHSTVVISVEKGRGDLLWTGSTSPAEMSSDLTKILKASS